MFEKTKPVEEVLCFCLFCDLETQGSNQKEEKTNKTQHLQIDDKYSEIRSTIQTIVVINAKQGIELLNFDMDHINHKFMLFLLHIKLYKIML